MSAGTIQSNWKLPDELIKLHRLKQKKKQLAARLNQKNTNKVDTLENDKALLLEAKIAQKRKNPFAKFSDNAKKQRTCEANEQDDSLLGFVNMPSPTTAQQLRCVDKETNIPSTPTSRSHPAKLVLQPFDAKAFSKLLHQTNNFGALGAGAGVANDEDDAALEEQKFSKHLPMDWSLKTRVRFFCCSDLPATTLKTSQMASGLTSFVRCIDPQNSCSGLDISPATRFSQATYYWQHPHLPWMTLFPRNSKENIGIALGERERKALADDWDNSFRGLFQLLRSRQCPYFYLCANTFTVLFRAAGTGGCVETHALMSPSTRGMRSALRQEGIEYTMPLKKESNLNKSGDSSFSEESNTIGFLVSGSNAREETLNDNGDEDNKEEEEDEGEWLVSLGVDEKEIRKINTAQARKVKVKEMSEDFSDNSLLLIEGVECQGFFSFLLNAKSTITNVGRLAGVPPTLFAPVAFPKATMQHLATRSSKVRMDGVDYCSIETKGVIMPTFLPYVCQLLGETKDTFSATLASSNNTLAFSKATQKLLEETRPSVDEHKEQEHSEQKRTEDKTAGQVFGQENLSDCGLLHNEIECMCRTGQYAVGLLERVCYDKQYGYAWS